MTEKTEKTGYTIQEVCMTFIQRQMFYAVILSKVNKIEFKGVKTAGVGFNKFGKLCFFYNPDFISKLPLNEAQGLVEHEVNHIFWRHLTRFPMTNTAAGISGKIKEMHDNRIINLGTDCSINQYLKDLPTYKEGDKDIGAETDKGEVIKVGDSVGVYPSTFDLDEGEAADYYIAALRKKMPEPPKIKLINMKCKTCNGTGKKQDDSDSQKSQDKKDGGSGQQDCPDCGGSGNQEIDGLDSHDLWGKVVEINPKTGEATITDCKHHDIDPEYECENIVKKSIKECKDFGKLPAHIEAEIKRMQAPPRHPWKQTLRVFMNSVLTVSKKLSTKRSNRRFAHLDYILPGKKKSRRPRLLYVRDSSGSHFGEDIQIEVAKEMEQISKRADVFVCDCDTEIHDHDGKQYYKMKKWSDIKPIKGGGGTDLRPPFKLARKLGVDGIVYATDTWGKFPEPKDIGKFANNTIWLTFDQAEVDTPFGKHVNIEDCNLR